MLFPSLLALFVVDYLRACRHLGSVVGLLSLLELLPDWLSENVRVLCSGQEESYAHELVEVGHRWSLRPGCMCHLGWPHLQWVDAVLALLVMPQDLHRHFCSLSHFFSGKE